jgi:SAM-dependent methyltransferase
MTAEGDAVDSGSGRADRHRMGAWYTPSELVAHVLDETIEPLLAERATPLGLRVLDPACGDGRFLVAVARRVAARYGVGFTEAAACVEGVDIDSGALAAARDALGPGARLQRADALTHPWELGAYDAVVTNPPFLGQLERDTTRGGRSSWGGGPYADAAAVFLALAMQLVRPRGGRVGLVLPQAVLATRDAGPIRSLVARQSRMGSLWIAREPVFDADVATCIATFVLGESPGPIERSVGLGFTRLSPVTGTDLAGRATWSHLIADVIGIPAVEPRGTGVVGERATATAGFREQYYGIASHVADVGPGVPLITTGLIDPGHCHWGQRRVRFNRRHYTAPRVDVDALEAADARLGRWARQRLVPKVVVATQTAVIEAAVDAEGAWFPSVPVISVEPSVPSDVWAIAAALTSPVVSAYAAARYAGAGLSPTSFRLSANQVLDLPLPPAPWPEATDRFRRGDLAGCGRALCALEDAGDEVYEWWWERIRRRTTGGSRPDAG